MREIWNVHTIHRHAGQNGTLQIICVLEGDFPLTEGMLLAETDERELAKPDAVPCPLSDRELSVLRQLGAGKSYKEIAADMGRSVSTVRTHLFHIYGKSGVNDRAHAVLLAVRNGWIENPV